MYTESPCGPVDLLQLSINIHEVWLFHVGPSSLPSWVLRRDDESFKVGVNLKQVKFCHVTAGKKRFLFLFPWVDGRIFSKLIKRFFFMVSSISDMHAKRKCRTICHLHMRYIGEI